MGQHLTSSVRQRDYVRTDLRMVFDAEARLRYGNVAMSARMQDLSRGGAAFVAFAMLTARRVGAAVASGAAVGGGLLVLGAVCLSCLAPALSIVTLVAAVGAVWLGHREVGQEGDALHVRQDGGDLMVPRAREVDSAERSEAEHVYRLRSKGPRRITSRSRAAHDALTPRAYSCKCKGPPGPFTTTAVALKGAPNTAGPPMKWRSRAPAMMAAWSGSGRKSHSSGSLQNSRKRRVAPGDEGSFLR